MTLTERAAAYERRFLTRTPEVQEALIGVARSLSVILTGGTVPTEDVLDLVDLLQNAQGKIERDPSCQERVLAEVVEGAPTVAGRFFEALGVAV